MTMDFRDILRAKPLVAEHLKKDFGAFCRAAWPALHPGTKLSWTLGHDLICEYLVAVHQKRLTRLAINCPPRFAKSTIVNVCFPVWLWLQDPSRSFLCCSYEIDLALNMNLDRRRLMESKWFRDLFADAFELSSDRSQAGDFSNTSGGAMQAASVNSKAQGRGGDVVIVDDPLSADFAYSESFRNETNLWFTNQLPQRLNNPSESAIVLIMQRLHQNDPTGFLLGQEDSEWKLLKLPLICEQDEQIVFPISGRVWNRKKNDCLDLKRWSPRTIRQRQQNRLVWAGQFQQEPMSIEGNLIRADDILFFGGRDPKTGEIDPGLPESFERKIISVDAAFKDKATSDYVAIIVVGIAGSRRYVLHTVNSHLDLTGTENEIRNCRAQFGPISAVLIEDKANGISVIAHLKDEIPGVIPIDPQGGKMARVVAASPEFQAKNWYFDRTAHWTNQTVTQLTMFPNCKHDDITDAITQASVWLQSHTFALGLLDYYQQLASGTKKLVKSVHEQYVQMPGAAATEMPASVTGKAWRAWTERRQAPPCPHPECMNTSTALVPDAHGDLHVFCKQCARTDGREMPKQFGGCCGHFLRQVVAGQVRCGNCGWQSRAPTIVSLSRKDYAAGRGRYRGYCRF
jgi:predicted phage terminase large subunit-like protein